MSGEQGAQPACGKREQPKGDREGERIGKDDRTERCEETHHLIRQVIT